MSSFWGRVGQVFRLSGPVPQGGFFVGGNYAEKNVTIDTVLNISTAWACARLISGTLATLPLHVMQRDEKGVRRLAKDHPVSEVLRGQPNANQTPVEFKEGMFASLVLRGMAYARKVRMAGELVSLQPIDYDLCIPMRRENGSLYYQVTNKGGRQEEVSPDDIFVLKGFTDNRDPDIGLSTIAYGRQTFGNTIAVEETVGKQYAKGLKQSGFFQMTNPAARLDKDSREQLQKVLSQYSGSSNAGSAMLLEAGLEWRPMNMNPKDMEMLGVRGMNGEEVCRWFGVPPPMVGLFDKMTTWPGGQSGMRADFRDFCLLTYITRFEEACNMRLLTREERMEGYFVKLSSEGLLRGDLEARTAHYASATQNGYLNRDTVRELEDWDLMPQGSGGEIYTVQQNLTPLSMLQAEAEARTMKNAGTPPEPTAPTPGV